MTVLSEEQFLSGLGLEQHGEMVRQLYRADALAGLLGVPKDRVRAWARAGLIRPRRVEHGAWYFDFRQVSVARSISDLSARGVSLGRLRRSLTQLGQWLPEAAEPLSRLAALGDHGRLLVRLEQGDLSAGDGQLHFDFEDFEDGSGPRLSLRIGEPATRPRSAAEWHDLGLEQEAAGLPEEAAESYRQALLAGGPHAANVLRPRRTCYTNAGN